MTQISKGKEVVDFRGTRSRKATTNLKTDLLDCIRVLEVGWHSTYDCTPYPTYVYPDNPGFPNLRNLQTIRFMFGMWCSCPDSVHCELCDHDDGTRTFCRILNNARASKVVLTSIRAYNAPAVLRRLGPILKSASTVTIVLSPDTTSFDISLANDLAVMFGQNALPPSRLEVRLIVVPWSHYTCAAARKASLDRGSFHVSWKLDYPRSAFQEEMISFFARLASTKYDTTVYLIQEGHPPFTVDKDDWEPPESLDKVQIENSVMATFGDDATKWPNIEFKTRADYLREGVTDEIDHAELKRWAEEERKVAEAEEAQIYGRSMAEERRRRVDQLVLDGRDVSSGCVFEKWLEEWIQEKNETTKMEQMRNAYDAGLCLEMDCLKIGILDEEISLFELSLVEVDDSLFPSRANGELSRRELN